MSCTKLYSSPDLANRIRLCAKEKGISIKSLLEKCELGSNTISHMLHGRSIAFDSLAKIADTLNCSVDYLLGRTDDYLVFQNYDGLQDNPYFIEITNNFLKLNEDGQTFLAHQSRVAAQDSIFLQTAYNSNAMEGA